MYILFVLYYCISIQLSAAICLNKRIIIIIIVIVIVIVIVIGIVIVIVIVIVLVVIVLVVVVVVIIIIISARFVGGWRGLPPPPLVPLNPRSLY